MVDGVYEVCAGIFNTHGVLRVYEMVTSKGQLQILLVLYNYNFSVDVVYGVYAYCAGYYIFGHKYRVDVVYEVYVY